MIPILGAESEEGPWKQGPSSFAYGKETTLNSMTRQPIPIPRRLTQQELAFVEEYAKTRNPKTAAVTAGYITTPVKSARWLLKRPEIQAALLKAAEKLRGKSLITEERVLEEYAAVAFFDPNDLYDANGMPYAYGELPRRVRGALQKFNIIERVDKKGNPVPGVRVMTGKPYDKLQALEALSRHLGLFERDNVRKLEVAIGVLVQGMGLHPDDVAKLKTVLAQKLSLAAPHSNVIPLRRVGRHVSGQEDEYGE